MLDSTSVQAYWRKGRLRSHRIYGPCGTAGAAGDSWVSIGQLIHCVSYVSCIELSMLTYQTMRYAINTQVRVRIRPKSLQLLLHGGIQLLFQYLPGMEILNGDHGLALYSHT